MPSKRRMKRDAQAKIGFNKAPKSHKSRKRQTGNSVPAPVPIPETCGGEHLDGANRRVELSFTMPRSTVISGTVATAGASGLVGAIATGNVDPVFVWPSIAMMTAGMGYDLVRRVVDRARKP